MSMDEGQQHFVELGLHPDADTNLTRAFNDAIKAHAQMADGNISIRAVLIAMGAVMAGYVSLSPPDEAHDIFQRWVEITWTSILNAHQLDELRDAKPEGSA